MATSKFSTLDGIKLHDQRNTFRCDPGKIVQVKITGLCSASDCFGFVRSRKCSTQWTNDFFTLEDGCKTLHWSGDNNSKLHGSERSCGERISHRESKKGKSLRWVESGEMLSVESTWTMFQSHDTAASGKSAQVKDQKDDRLHQIRRQRLTKGKKKSGNKEESTSDNRSENCHVNLGILPCVETASQKKDAYMERSVSSDMLRQWKNPAKGEWKVAQKHQLYFRSLYSWSCVSRDLYPRNSFPRDNFSKGTWHQIQIRERKGPSRGINHPKVCTSWAESLRAKIRGKITWRDAPAEQRGNWKKCCQAEEFGQTCVLYSCWSEGNADTHLEKTRTQNLQSIQERQCTWWAKKNKAQRNWTLSEGTESMSFRSRTLAVLSLEDSAKTTDTL